MTSLPGGEGRCFASKFVHTEAGNLNYIGIYSTSTGNGLVKGVIYADNGGVPGALVAVGSAVAVVSNGWVQSLLSGQPLPPGTYWVGAVTQDWNSNLHADSNVPGDTGVAKWGGTSADYDSPPSPWPSPGLAPYLLSIFVDYSTGGGEPDPDPGTGSVTATLAVATLSSTGELGEPPEGYRFGQTFPGIQGTWSGNAGRIIASRFYLAEEADFLSYTQHFGYGADASGNDPGGVNWIGILFEDVAGEPGDVVAVTSPAVTTGAGRWQSTALQGRFSPGYYWFGTQADSFALTINSTTVAEGGLSGNIRRAEGSSLAIGVGDPWPGTASTGNGNLTAYVTYTRPQHATELAAATLSATGTLELKAELSATLAVATLASAGASEKNGGLEVTLQELTAVSEGRLALQGSLVQTLQATSATAQGQLAIEGNLSSTLQASSITAQGTVAIEGVVVATLQGLTLESESGSVNAGRLEAQLASIGFGSEAQLLVQGRLLTELAPATLAASGVLHRQGNLAITLESATLQSESRLQVTGSVEVTLARLTLEAADLRGAEGNLEVTLAPVLSLASGRVEIRANLTATLQELTVTQGQFIPRVVVRIPERISRVNIPDRVFTIRN